MVLLNKSPFQVIGIYKSAGDFMSEPSPRAYVPFSAGRRYLNLWIDWIDSSSQVGYAELISGSWSSVATEGYSGSNDIEPARGRVRTAVLN